MPHVFIDGGKWYPWALQKFGFRYTIVKFGPRSAIESMQNWIEAFAGFRNLHKEKEVLS